ncbi:MAG: hypothetical protein SF182_01810 [Deltaproteobacteria bacterium]|nr:hypothetical protein [Deltaproteobacteria bacterium]
MERRFRLTASLACLGERDDLPAGALVIEPRQVRADAVGDILVFLEPSSAASTHSATARFLGV